MSQRTAAAGKFETFGPFLFLKKLATGGMAEVFLARPANQNGNGRVQVVKRILSHVGGHSLFLSMFQREIQVIMGFNHPHAVQLHDFGNINGQPFISMEYIEGKNLKELVNKFASQNAQMPVPMALSLVAQCASGLHYAHTFENPVTGEAVNAVHRDITPHNLIVSYDGNLKVIDFGIAKAACGMPEMTRTGMIKGKAAYLAPEQINGGELDARTDIFALGIVAWEMLTLKRLFMKDGDNEVSVMARINNCDQHVLPPSTHNPEIPKEIDEIILRAIQKNPDDRYSSAKDFQSALRQAMIKFCPTYSYSEAGEVISSLFAEEIQRERRELRELNIEAQHSLVGDLEDTTQISTDAATPRGSSDHAAAYAPTMPLSSMGGHTNSGSMRYSDPSLSHVDIRLMKIEALMKQKATTRHYVMLAIYIVSLFALKLGDYYDVFAYFLPQPKEAAAAAPAPNLVRRPPRSTASADKTPRTESRSSSKAKAKKPPTNGNKKSRR